MLTTLKAPCWRLVTSTGEDHDDGRDGAQHYDTEVDALQDITDRKLEGVTAKAYDTRCIVIRCNGCNAEPESGDFTHLHFLGVNNAANGQDYMVIVGEEAWCEDCRHKPHPFVADPDGGQDCARCAEPADEHDDVTGDR